jgi:hypothetical protein
MILFRNGQEVHRVIGVRRRKELEAELQPALAA